MEAEKVETVANAAEVATTIGQVLKSNTGSHADRLKVEQLLVELSNSRATSLEDALALLSIATMIAANQFDSGQNLDDEVSRNVVRWTIVANSVVTGILERHTGIASETFTGCIEARN